MREDVETFVAEQKAMNFTDTKISHDQTVDGDHGRIEARTTTVIHDVGWLQERHDWPGLTAAETQALVRALDAEANQDAASALALLILTGARKQEVLRATWELVDLERGVLTVPLSKSGRPRHVPLSPHAVRVLQVQAGRRIPGNPYVFPSRVVEGRPLGGCASRGTGRSGRPVCQPADLRIHDLRHCLASALANAGPPLYEIGAVLGHRQLSTTRRSSWSRRRRRRRGRGTCCRRRRSVDVVSGNGGGSRSRDPPLFFRAIHAPCRSATATAALGRIRRFGQN